MKNRSWSRSLGVMLVLGAMVMSACNQKPSKGTTPAPGVNAEVPKIQVKGAFDEAKFADLIKAAKAEGELSIYGTAAPEGTEKIGKVFKDKFGVNVTYWRTTVPVMIERFTSEARTGKGPDVLFSVGFPTYYTFIKQGLLAEYTPANADLFTPDSRIDNYAYPHHFGAVVIVANTQLLKPEELDTLRKEGWKGLLQPSLKGRIAIPDATGAVSQEVLWYMLMEAKSSEYGVDFVKKLAAQKPGIMKLSSLSGEAVSRGEYAAAIGFDTVNIVQYAQGAKIQMFYANPSTYMPLQFTISKTAAHSSAARLWMEWVTSREGQQYANEVFLAMPALPGMEDKRTITKEPWWKIAKPEDLFTVHDLDKYNAAIPKVRQQFSEIFNYKP